MSAIINSLSSKFRNLVEYCTPTPPAHTTKDKIMELPLLNDFTLIKSTVAPFRAIMDATFANWEFKRISRIDATEAPPNSPYAGLTVYTIHVHSEQGTEPHFEKGAAGFPPEISTELRRSVFKLEACDLAVNTFLPRVADALQPLGARVEWLEVRAHPRIMIRYPDQPLDSPIHSVFCITAKTGEQFVADFTVEQFGYDDTCWFMNKDEYLAVCTTNGQCRVATDSQIASVAQDHADNSYENGLTETLRAVCDNLGWSTFGNIPTDQRIAWVRSRVVELLEGWET
jgi:hypothetical protein